MKKVIVVIGTRPEAIKMAPLVRSLSATPSLQVEILNTGQHRELLDGVLEIFGLKADHVLGLMSPGQSLGELTSRAIRELEKQFKELEPSMVLVHGDTTTALCAGIAAFYLGIPVGHVEAGLRTRDLTAPFPEELNRQMIARLANLNFAPTDIAGENLIQEGVDPATIFVTGNTVVDATVWVNDTYLSDAAWSASQGKHLAKQIPGFSPERPYGLVTLHRRENHGGNFERVLTAIQTLAFKHRSVDFVFPVHPNPIIRELANEMLAGADNIILAPPLDYLEFSFLLSRAIFALSDSGGVQEEGLTYGIPVLVARETTERPEGLKSGLLTLVGSNQSQIIETISEIIKSRKIGDSSLNLSNNPFGDGYAASRISLQVEAYLTGASQKGTQS